MWGRSVLAGARIRRSDQALEALRSVGAFVLEAIAVSCPTRAGRGDRLIVPGGDQEVTPR